MAAGEESETLSRNAEWHAACKFLSVMQDSTGYVQDHTKHAAALQSGRSSANGCDESTRSQEERLRKWGTRT